MYGELKSFDQTWLGGMRCRADNEVKVFYLDSLERTGTSTKGAVKHRKILACLWTIWWQEISYDPMLFYDYS